MNDIDTNTEDDARDALQSVLGELAEVHERTDVERFIAGWVDAVSDRHVRVLSVDSAGRPDGIEIRRLDNVERVVTEGDYLTRRLKPLIAFWNNEPVWPTQRLTGNMDDLVMDALTVSIEDGIVVTMFMRDTCQYTGPVVKLSDDAGTIADLDHYGVVEREVAFKLSDIDALNLGGDYERVAQHLMSWS